MAAPRKPLPISKPCGAEVKEVSARVRGQQAWVQMESAIAESELRPRRVHAFLVVTARPQSSWAPKV